MADKALIVDDTVDIHRIARFSLSPHGWSVDGARTLAEAVDRLNAEHYDMAFVDLRLPDGDGMDLVRALYHARRDIIDTVIITGWPTEEALKQGLAYGILDFVAKPITRVQFESMLRKREIRRGMAAGVAPASLSRVDAHVESVRRVIHEARIQLQTLGEVACARRAAG